MTSQKVKPEFQYKNAMEEIATHIKSRIPIIWVLTHEEARFLRDFQATIARPNARRVYLWSGYQGLVPLENERTVNRASGEENETWNPQKALSRIAAHTVPSSISLKTQEAGEEETTTTVPCKGLCYIMRDFHTVLAEPIPRQLRDMYDHLTFKTKTLIITAPQLAHGPGGSKSGLPPTLEKQIAVVYYDLPDRDLNRQRIMKALDHMKTRATPGTPKQLSYTEEEISALARACQGLTQIEIDNTIANSITHLHRLDIDKLIHEKRQIIRKSQILEFVETPVDMNDVGGLDLAKQYLSKYAKANSDQAREFGVELLKGILLTGVPGTGNSLLAKAIGRLWQEPLLRLDVGKVMTGLVGGSEEKMREVINQAEAMAPCVLWIDEVEKSLSGTKRSNFSDGGTLARVFGTLLTAMQDGLEGVTLVATANDITMLPPEFIRRYSEVFFIDLPGPDERWDIFSIHLKKRGRTPEDFVKHRAALLDASNDYTGAEIEKAVKDATAAAFYEGKGVMTHKHLLEALKDTKPISRVMADKVSKLRERARGQYRFGSSYAEQQMKTRKVATTAGKPVDVNEALDDLSTITQTPKEKAQATADADRFDLE